jgi:hypothetical protein
MHILSNHLANNLQIETADSGLIGKCDLTGGRRLYYIYDSCKPDFAPDAATLKICSPFVGENVCINPQRTYSISQKCILYVWQP